MSNAIMDAFWAGADPGDLADMAYDDPEAAEEALEELAALDGNMADAEDDQALHEARSEIERGMNAVYGGRDPEASAERRYFDMMDPASQAGIGTRYCARRITPRAPLSRIAPSTLAPPGRPQTPSSYSSSCCGPTWRTRSLEGESKDGGVW